MADSSHPDVNQSAIAASLSVRSAAQLQCSERHEDITRSHGEVFIRLTSRFVIRHQSRGDAIHIGDAGCSTTVRLDVLATVVRSQLGRHL